MSWIKDFFKGGEAKTLKKDLEDLKTALTECNERLAEKQEHINKTNAYWKRKELRKINLKNKDL